MWKPSMEGPCFNDFWWGAFTMALFRNESPGLCQWKQHVCSARQNQQFLWGDLGFQFHAEKAKSNPPLLERGFSREGDGSIIALFFPIFFFVFFSLYSLLFWIFKYVSDVLMAGLMLQTQVLRHCLCQRLKLFTKHLWLMIICKKTCLCSAPSSYSWKASCRGNLQKILSRWVNLWSKSGQPKIG